VFFSKSYPSEFTALLKKMNTFDDNIHLQQLFLMKIKESIILSTILFIGISCTEPEANDVKEDIKTEIHQESKAQVPQENFDWLLGNWKRLDEESGKETFEFWEKKNELTYKGLGFTLQNGDTIKQEKMKLIMRKGQWFLEVQPNDEPKDFIFPMYTFTETEFICKNPNIGFPQLIKYHFLKEKLYAIVSGEGLDIIFEFEKIVDSN